MNIYPPLADVPPNQTRLGIPGAINSFFVGVQAVPECEWLEYRKVSGVYAIRHIASGKFYIGSGVSIYTRWSSHRTRLNANKPNCKSTNKYLQNAWNKYGKDAFEFVLLERTSRDRAVSVEQVWLDWTKATEQGYNITPTAGSVLGMRLDPEARKKISDALTGRKRPPEVIAKMSASKKGKKPSLASRRNQAAAQVGLKHTQAAKDKIGAAHRGRKYSDDTKARMSAAKRAKSSVTIEAVEQIKKRYVKGDKLNGGQALAKKFGISEMTVSRIVRGLTWA